jgi:hypothetical protein
VALSTLVGQTTPSELAQYSGKIIIFREAMRNPGGSGVRPDITDLDANTAYEIKSRADAFKAFTELHQFYLPRYNELALSRVPPLRILVGGSWAPPLLYYDAPERSIVVITNEGLGAIIYDVFRVPDEVVSGVLALLITLALINLAAKKLGEFRFPEISLPEPDEEFVRASQQAAETVRNALIAIALAVLAGFLFATG